MEQNNFDTIQQIAQTEFGVSVVRDSWNKEEVWNAIHELSDIRARYNMFDDNEVGKYHACCLAIRALRAAIGE